MSWLWGFGDPPLLLSTLLDLHSGHTDADVEVRTASGVSDCACEGASVGAVDDDAIRVLLTRLARPHPSGGEVIERAAILAEGADSAAVMAWIVAHAGIPEATVAAAPRHGLHGSRLGDNGGAGPRTPLRYVLPAGALA